MSRAQELPEELRYLADNEACLWQADADKLREAAALIDGQREALLQGIRLVRWLRKGYDDFAANEWVSAARKVVRGK